MSSAKGIHPFSLVAKACTHLTNSNLGHRRAFVQFESIESSVAFIREHFPKLLLELPHPTDEAPDGKFEVYVHFARNREEADHRGSGAGNWTCPSVCGTVCSNGHEPSSNKPQCDYSNYPTRVKCKICGALQSGVFLSSQCIYVLHDSDWHLPETPDWQQSLTGQTDAANVPSQILVVYPLAGFVNEDMLAGDMKRLELEKQAPIKDTSSGAPKLKSTAPTGDASGLGARPGSLHRVFLMRDVYNNESFKYGFAEFWTLEDATAAMAKYRASRSFTVAACQVNVSTIHMGVFLPEERELTPDIERMSFHPLFNPSLRVRYRDLRLYPSEKVVTSESSDAGEQSKTSADETKKSKKRKAEGSLAASGTKKPVVMAGQMAMWQRKHDELHGQQTGTKPDQDKQTDQPPRGSARCLDNPPKHDPNAPIKISLTGAKIGAPSSAKQTPSPPPPEFKESEEQPQDKNTVSYVDRDRLMCLICMRKYKSVDEVNIHEKSRNHKTAMDNEDLVKAALPRLAARHKRLQKQAAQEGDGEGAPSVEPQYRDRAKERREIFKQPKKPSASLPPRQDGGKPAKRENEPPPAPKAPQQSKGAGMLAKMGWTTGSGLGAAGEGRIEVIESNAYQEGVGLGAEGGNLGDAAQLAERKTKNSYTDYVNSVQDKARERYNRME